MHAQIYLIYVNRCVIPNSLKQHVLNELVYMIFMACFYNFVCRFYLAWYYLFTPVHSLTLASRKCKLLSHRISYLRCLCNLGHTGNGPNITMTNSQSLSCHSLLGYVGFWVRRVTHCEVR